MEVWIVQLLCPDRHCFMGASYEKDHEDKGLEVQESIRASIEEAKLPWHCGICESTDLRFEHGKTRFTSAKEAEPFMAKLQDENIKTRMLVDLLKALGHSERLKKIRNGEELPEDLRKELEGIIGPPMDPQSN